MGKYPAARRQSKKLSHYQSFAALTGQLSAFTNEEVEIECAKISLTVEGHSHRLSATLKEPRELLPVPTVFLGLSRSWEPQ